MNGAQDMGGMMGFGPIQGRFDTEFFHAPWERRALGITLAMGATGTWNIDNSRHMREAIHPAEYLASSYYQLWIKGVEKLVLGKGLVTDEELRQGKALSAAKPLKRVPRPADIPVILAKGAPCDRKVDTPALFKPGDQVRMKNRHPSGHTRVPRYARGRLGVIERVHGGYIFPDTNAEEKGENPQWLYCVCFSARELWGAEGDASSTVSIDAWESYLEPV